MPKPHIRRCAVYTRKSSNEGLEQDFNSLDAQREACEAYIRSQIGDGWKPVRTQYDDGGYSGGMMERPGLQRLLADIRSQKIDIVIVYKVDRLTRALADFAKIVELFDAHNVSFVSVTQQFNTTSSMGRLTLNMLLSFAQFEREVTGERIRDKIAASKRKGMWMGGFVPLGYEPDGRTLTINESEAETVRTVFRLYLEHGNVRRVKEEADRRGLKTKRRDSANSSIRGSRPLSRGYIYKLLGNPLYVGRIAHKGSVYEGQHPAIVDKETWNEVQAMLAGNRNGRSDAARSTEPSPLIGKLYDEAGASLTPTHSVKSGRRYRYYVSRKPIPDAREANSNTPAETWRLPAREIERVVAKAVTDLLANHGSIAEMLRDSGVAANLIAGLLHAIARWRDEPLKLIQRADLAVEGIVLSVDLSPIAGEAMPLLSHPISTRIKRRGAELRLVLHGTKECAATPDPALIKIVGRARTWFEDIAHGKTLSLQDIARANEVSKRYVGQLIPIAFLAPDIVEAILSGTQPADLTAELLSKQTAMPLDWAEQRALLGFDPTP